MLMRKARVDGIRETVAAKGLSLRDMLEMYGYVELPPEDASSKGGPSRAKDTSRGAIPKKSVPTGVVVPQRRSVLMRAVADKAGRAGTSTGEKKDAALKRKSPEHVTVAEHPPATVEDEMDPDDEDKLVRVKRAKKAEPVPDAIPITSGSTPLVEGVQGESAAREPEKVEDVSANLRQIVLSRVRMPQPTGRPDHGDAPAPAADFVADTEVAMRMGRQAFLPRDERELVGRPMDQLQRVFTGSVFRVSLALNCAFGLSVTRY
jgi:hypothetical protein